FQHLVEGDGDSAEKHREFYDEYLAVMDLTAEFYLQTVETVFIRHALPEGTMEHNGRIVDCSKITRTALLTVEGEKDDITGRGQTRAAHALCTSLPDDMKAHYEQPNVGHYGVFNGSRWRSEIAPRVMDFIRSNRAGAPKKAPPKSPAKVASAEKTKPATKPKTKTAPAGPLAKILLAKPDGAADNLKEISGVGPKLESALNEAGIFHFWQIASLTGDQIEALDSKLDFRGRIERDKWIEQARQLSEAVS
ncbi:MAG: polyhydroxyalkanoate depolymerase, partial [Rhodobacteraceae bacterium]|nr:polyhydroxyalkanoate depolymerase [Paracoccaceae bacterium]